MALLTKEQILGASDLPSEDVLVEEWGGWVKVRRLTLKEIDAAIKSRTGADYIYELVAAATVLENGEKLTAEEVSNKSAKAVTSIFKVASRLNGIDAEASERSEKN